MYATYACITSLSQSLMTLLIFVCKGGRSKNLKENKAIYAALFPRPALNLLWKTLFNDPWKKHITY